MPGRAFQINGLSDGFDGIASSIGIDSLTIKCRKEARTKSEGDGVEGGRNRQNPPSAPSCFEREIYGHTLTLLR